MAIEKMKHDYKKCEKDFYIPKTEPTQIQIPPYTFFTLSGQGNPNSANFSEAIGVLYSLSYAVKMFPKKHPAPNGYFEYSVYPLEGIWDLSENAKQSKIFNKNELLYTIMIRQPNFVTSEFAAQILEETKKKKPHPFLDSVTFEQIEDGLCVQMLHIGSYDDEPHSFEKMKQFCAEKTLIQNDLRHREIYLSDSRKVAPEKLKTVLRYFRLKKNI